MTRKYFDPIESALVEAGHTDAPSQLAEEIADLYAFRHYERMPESEAALLSHVRFVDIYASRRYQTRLRQAQLVGVPLTKRGNYRYERFSTSRNRPS